MLRAPPRRVAVGNKIKWLHDEHDGDWRNKNSKNKHQSWEENIPVNVQQTVSTLKFGGKLGDKSTNQETDNWTKKFSNTKA